MRYDLRSFGASPTDDVEFSARADSIAVLDDFGIDRAALAATARAVAWPDVAHMIGMEAPDRLNALIVDFLAPLRPWA